MDFINVKWMKEIGCHPYSKVAKNNFWKGARGPHPIGNFGEVAVNGTSPKFPMR